MTSHARRLAAALTLIMLGAVAALAGCGGSGDTDDSGNDPDSTPANGQESTTPSVTPTPTEPSFDQVPGKPLAYQRFTSKFTVVLKPVRAEWVTQFGDKPAEPDSKFLVVYTALRPELMDRGVERLQMDEIWLRYEPTGAACTDAIPVGAVETCFAPNQVTVKPVPLSDIEWRKETWASLEYTGIDLVAGTEYRTPLVFSVKDTAAPEKGFLLCANPDGGFTQHSTKGKAPCVPVPAPEAAEN